MDSRPANDTPRPPRRSVGVLGLKCSLAGLFVPVGRWNIRRRRECLAVLRWLAPRPGERILDIGCGDGLYDARIAMSGARVVGIEINEGRLRLAQRLGVGGRLEFLRMDAEEMDFPDSSFDKAVSFCTVEHFRRDDRALAEIGRVLKPGGRFVFSADSLSGPEISESERLAHRLRYGVNDFYTAESVRLKLAAAGLSLEAFAYVLTTPVSLSLARLSWRLDDFPHPYAFFPGFGHFVLGTAGQALSDLSELLAGPRPRGLTLIAHARKL